MMGQYNTDTQYSENRERIVIGDIAQCNSNVLVGLPTLDYGNAGQAFDAF